MADMKHAITLIPGDGIGPEVSAAVVRILEAAGAATGVSSTGTSLRRGGGVRAVRRVHSAGALPID